MGQIKEHSSVKLIAGFIYHDEEIFQKAVKILKAKFGASDFICDPIAFVYTDYYRKEFGSGLKRRFAGFAKLIPSEKLPEIKIITNKIEQKLSNGANRLINIDPGYLTMAKLVLATTKDFAHRLYLDKGIYGEVTLFYQKKSYKPWDWTYPDYRTSEYIAIFNQIRNIYAAQIKEK